MRVDNQPWEKGVDFLNYFYSLTIDIVRPYVCGEIYPMERKFHNDKSEKR